MFWIVRVVFLNAVFTARTDVVKIDCAIRRKACEKVYITPDFEWKVQERDFAGYFTRPL
jgi:hypothetical protein